MIEAKKAQIESVLSALVGLPLWSAGRFLDLEMFEFGPRHLVRDHRGNEREGGEYALHTQCAWRITGPQGIVAGSRDRFRPRGNPAEVPDDFDCNVSGTTLCDQRVDALFAQHSQNSLLVEQVKVGEWGAFSLALNGGISLDVFPDSTIDEHWRLCRYLENPHFVVTGSGIEDD
jgi:hypothetical protein